VIASFAAAANREWCSASLCRGESRREICGVGSEPASPAIEAEPAEQKYHHEDDQ
jgi:hypothetical protein